MWLQALVDSGCTQTGIDKQLVKEEQIKTEPVDKIFEVFNVDRTRNRVVTWRAPLEIEINRHKERINVVVIDLNNTNMFLKYNWLIKHNPEVDWNKETIQFTWCSRTCRINHQDISFIPRNQRTIAKDNNDKGQQEIGKESDPMSPEDLPNYIWPFMHLFNKKKFKKLPERRE